MVFLPVEFVAEQQEGNENLAEIKRLCMSTLSLQQ